jgi:hypothetical protein
VPNLIAELWRSRCTTGDLEQGSNSPCDAALYERSLGAQRAPAMFTPGDNDWTHCDRPSNGGDNSLDRLDYERQVRENR